jgi:transcriptional regulator with XRE-family HTH domain
MTVSNDTTNTLGRALREARTARGLTPQELADLLHMGPEHVAMYEDGSETPVGRIIDAWMEVCGASFNVLPPRYLISVDWADEKVTVGPTDPTCLIRLPAHTTVWRLDEGEVVAAAGVAQ